MKLLFTKKNTIFENILLPLQEIPLKSHFSVLQVLFFDRRRPFQHNLKFQQKQNKLQTCYLLSASEFTESTIKING